MSKPSSKTKDEVRSRRQRNLVAKHNPHKGGYHTPNRYERRGWRDDWERITDLEMEYGDIDELH
jgi:hypothetical protein